MQSQPAALDSLRRAHNEKDLKIFLIPYFTFRAYVKFTDGKTRHFYGNEHRVTYKQCLAGKVPHIALKKYDGLKNLIEMIEHTIKGRWKSAKIYMRAEGSTEYDILCYDYYKGVKTVHHDPMVAEDEAPHLLIYYTVNPDNGRLMFQTEKPTAPSEDLPDFKDLITKSNL